MKNTRTSLNRFPKRQLYTLLLLALPALQAHADTYTWTGILDNNFNDANNWQLTSTDTDPNGYDQMVLNTNGTTAYYTIADGNGIVVTPGGAYTPRSLSIGTGSGQQGALTATRLDYSLTSGHYAYLSFLNVGVEGGSGQLDLHHNDSIPYQPTIFQVSGGLNIGSGAGSEGVVNLLGQGKSIESQNMGMSTLSLESGSASIGTDGGKGTLTIDGAGFTANSSTNIILGSGSGGEGTINILGGGKLTAGVMGVPSSYRPIVGDDGGTGYLNISGTSADGVASRAVIGNSLAVGQNGGLGEVSITQGGKLLTTTAYDDPASIQLGVNGGTGKVTIDGSNSIWEVAGYSYFTGGSLGQVGELHVGVSGSGELTVGNGGKLTIGQLEYGNDYDPVKNQSYYYETNFAGGSGTLYLADEAGSSGTINIGAPVGQAAQGTGILDILDIQFGAGNGTIVFNHTDTSGSYTFDTPLVSGSGYSLIRQVAGTTTLADQPGFTGDISVEGGTLLINGSQSIDNGYVSGGLFLINGDYTASNTGVTGGYLEVLGQVNSPVTISGSGTLSGNGIIAGDVTVGSGGTVSPGTSQGATLDTLTVDSITFNPGSLYWAQSNPDRTTDMIHASTANGGSGAITLNGGTVHVVAASNGWQEGTRYDLLRADSGVTGHFDSITTNLAFLTPGLEYDPTHAYLYFTRNSTNFGDIGGTYNEINTGWGIQGLNPGHPVYDSIVSMSAEEARATYDNLSGEIHASAKSALFTNSRYARAAVNQHLGSLNT
ncbi:autotransporter outer membrane beta-barrel domain-containing protein, partial [Saezia sanguinis]|uniref:autotransporter outer membrane beta-barrel domain-containing protein n=1 Tax=Saezia sanguinis TaxID=1965230 RepID=UPI001950E4C6